MIFLTGATGYIGSYVATKLLAEQTQPIAVLVRATDAEHAKRRLWKAWQLHLPFDAFSKYVDERVEIVVGDLTAPDLGLDAKRWAEVAERTRSMIHIAASLNRKSAKACFNVNLRGTLSVIRLAREAVERGGLDRFSDVSTVAVSGFRSHETVTEENIIDWGLSDYDPYARTKKFCEHMVHELLPDVQRLVFRPATVLGDSRFPETTQFDMVRAFVMLARMPVLPLGEDWRMDIVPVDYVSSAIVNIHLAEAPRYDSYNLSAGEGSQTYGQIVQAMAALGHRPPVFAPKLERPFTRTMDLLSNAPKRSKVALPASLMKVFMPYLAYNTVFDNTRVVEEMGFTPPPFSDYADPLFHFATRTGFRYPYQDWPE